jgi:hypothetical protein
MPVDKTKQQQIVKDTKIPKNSIPSPTEEDKREVIVNSIIFDVGPTKSAMERASAEQRDPNLFDGIVVKFAHLEYFRGNEQRKLITLGDTIEFPGDIKTPSGDISYCYITNEEYLTLGRITKKGAMFGGFSKPDTEAALLVLYDASFCMQIGTDPGILIDTILSVDGLVTLSDEELARVGVTRPEKKQFPIISLYRYLEQYTDRLNKKQRKWNLTGYNKTTKQVDLGGSSAVRWVDEAQTLKLYDALAERELDIRAQKDSQTKFDSKSLEKEAGF